MDEKTLECAPYVRQAGGKTYAVKRVMQMMARHAKALGVSAELVACIITEWKGA